MTGETGILRFAAFFRLLPDGVPSIARPGAGRPSPTGGVWQP